MREQQDDIIRIPYYGIKKSYDELVKELKSKGFVSFSRITVDGVPTVQASKYDVLHKEPLISAEDD